MPRTSDLHGSVYSGFSGLWPFGAKDKEQKLPCHDSNESGQILEVQSLAPALCSCINHGIHRPVFCFYVSS